MTEKGRRSQLTSVPYSNSNLYHHAQLSPRSGSRLTALSNQLRAFSILRSAQNKRATTMMMLASSEVFLSASAERDLRPGRGSFQIEMAQSRPAVGHSCIAGGGEEQSQRKGGQLSNARALFKASGRRISGKRKRDGTHPSPASSCSAPCSRSSPPPLPSPPTNPDRPGLAASPFPANSSP